MTGERYIPQMRGQIYYEHVHRYALAERFCVGRNVVDIASGEGYGSALLARSAATVVGIDVSAEAIDHARKVYYRSNLRFIQGSSEQIPLADASVDAITSFETIEHVDDYRGMLREIRRILKPDGLLIISSPNKLVYTDEDRNQNDYHVNELYYTEFRDVLTAEFPSVTIFGQQIAAASIVSPLDIERLEGGEWLTARQTSFERGLPSLPRPVYFIAVCGPDADARPDLSSAFIDPADDLLRDVWMETGRLRLDRDHYKGLATRAGLVALPGDTQGSSLFEQQTQDLVDERAAHAATQEERSRLQHQLDVLAGEQSVSLQRMQASQREAAERESAFERALSDAREREEATKRTLFEMREELERLMPERAEYYRMLESRSWRITEPIRIIARALSSRFR